MSFTLSLRFPGSTEFVDYTDYVLCHDQAVATKKWQQDEKPTLEFWLGPDLTDIPGMQIPVRGTEVHLDCSTYPNLFTGFVTTDQQLEVQGGVDDTLGGGVYGYKVDCTDEAILLDMHYVGNVQPFVNMTEGDILASLIQQLVPGRFTTTALDGWGDVQPYFAVTAQQKFTDIQKALLANKAAMLMFQRGVVTIGRYWDVVPYVVVSERGEAYNPSDLNLQTIPQDVRNDLTGVGAVEPQAYVREYTVSDGFNGLFPLAFMPFGQTDTPMLSDDFTGGSLDTQTWTSYDPSDSFDAFEGSLNAIGGLGYGLTFLMANLGLELKGKLRIKAGEFQFEGPCDGLVGVLTTVDPMVWNTMTNAECLAATILGWKFTPSGQNTDIQPILNGQLTGEVTTTQPSVNGIVPMTYTLEMFFAAATQKRSSSNWYSTSKYFVQPAPTQSGAEVNFQIVETSMLPVGLPVTTETSTVVSQQTQTPVIIEPPVRVQVATVQLDDPPDFVYVIEMACQKMNCAVNYMTVDQPIQVKVTAQQMSEQVIQYATEALANPTLVQSQFAVGSSTFTFTLPNAPSPGNLLVITCLGFYGGSADQMPAPTGFTQQYDSGEIAGAANYRAYAWTRIAQSGDPTTWTVTLNAGAQFKYFAIYEVSGGASFYSASAGEGGTRSTQFSAPAVTSPDVALVLSSKLANKSGDAAYVTGVSPSFYSFLNSGDNLDFIWDTEIGIGIPPNAPIETTYTFYYAPMGYLNVVLTLPGVIALGSSENVATLQLGLPPTVGNTLVFLATAWGGVPTIVPPSGLTPLRADTLNGGQNAAFAWSRVVQEDDPQEWQFSATNAGGVNFAVIEIAGEATLNIVDGAVVNSTDQVEAGAGISGIATYGSLAVWLIEWGGPTDCTLAKGATSSIPNQYTEPQDVEVLQSFGVDPAHAVALVASLNPQEGEQLQLTLNDTPTNPDVFIAFVANIPGPVENYVGELGDDESQCTILSSSTDASNKSGAALSYFSNDIPAAQSKLLVQYREAGLSLARVVDNASIADEAVRFGDNGVRAGLQTQFDPQAYSSMEVEARLQAMLDDLTQEHYQGTWVANVPHEYTFTAEPRPGVFARLQVPTRLPLAETVAQQVFLEDPGGNAAVTLNLPQVPDTGNQLVAMVTGEFTSITPPAGFTLVSQATGAGGIAVAVFQKSFFNGTDGKSWTFTDGGATAGAKNWALFELANVAQVAFATGVPSASGDQFSTPVLTTNIAAQQVSAIAMFGRSGSAALNAMTPGYSLLTEMVGGYSADVVESPSPANGAPASVTYALAPAATVYAVMVIAFDQTIMVLPQTVTTEIIVEEQDGTEVMKHTLEFGEFTSLRLDELLVKFNAQTVPTQVAQISQTQKLPPLDTNLVGTTFCDDLPDAVLVGQSESLFTIDAGVDLEIGQAVEIRSSDYGWGTGAGSNLVGWSYTRQFDVPRNSRQQTIYLKLLQISAWSPPAGIVSRFPTVLRMSYPLIPQPPTVSLYDQSDFLHPVFQATITSDPEDVFEVQWAVGNTGQIVSTVEYVSPDNLLFTYDNVNSLWTQTIYCRFINLLGEASDWASYAMVIPYPTVWDLYLNDGNSTLNWTTDPYTSQASGAVEFDRPGISSTDPATAIALNVGGQSGFIQAPPGDWFTPEFSLEIWVYPTSAATNQYVLWSGSDAGAPLLNTVEIYWADALANQPGVRITGPVNGQVLANVTAPEALARNTWHHLVATFDGTNLTFYVDGAKVGSTQIIGSLPIVQRPLTYFGKRELATGYVDNLFQGSVARFAIYEYVLTATQVSNHFGAQNFATYSVTVENDAPIGYLIMGDSGQFSIVANEMAVLNPSPATDVSYQIQISDKADFSDMGTTTTAGKSGPMGGSFAQATGSGSGFTNPNSALQEDGQMATVTQVGGNVPTGLLQISGFNFSNLPDDAQITGILVEVKAEVTANPSNSGCYLVNVNVAGGGSPKGMAYGSPIGTSLQYYSFGGQGDTFGGLQLTGAQCKSSAFYVTAGMQHTGGSGASATVGIDYIRVTLWYTRTILLGLTATSNQPSYVVGYDEVFTSPYYCRVRAVWAGGVGAWVTLNPTSTQLAAQVVQYTFGRIPGSTASMTLNLPQAPTVGNTLILLGAGYEVGVSSPSFTHDYGGGYDYQNVGVWRRVVQSGDTAQVTVTCASNGAGNFCLLEVEGVLASTGYSVQGGGTTLPSNLAMTTPTISEFTQAVVLVFFEWDGGEPFGTLGPAGYSVFQNYPSGGSNHCALLVAISSNDIPVAPVTGSITVQPANVIGDLAEYAYLVVTLPGYALLDLQPQLTAQQAVSVASINGQTGAVTVSAGTGVSISTSGQQIQVNATGPLIAGDIGGTQTDPIVVGLQGKPISNAAPTSGEVLTWNGSAWAPATPAGGVSSVFGRTGAVVAATGDYTAAQVTGAVQIGGDLDAGTAAAPKVTGLQGNPVASTSPTSNQVLTWNGSAWAPATVAAGVTSVFGRIGAVVAASGDYTAAQVTGAVQIGGDLDGGSPAAPVVTGLQGNPVASTTPTSGQVLAWNGSAWAPSAGVPGPTGPAGWTGVIIGFVINSGSIAAPALPKLISGKSGTLTKCSYVVTASDPTTNFTFNVKQNGTSVFASAPTIPAGTAAGSTGTFSLSSPSLAVNQGDVFEFDITAGSSIWVLSLQLET